MTNSPKKQVIGPEPPPPINEFKIRNDSAVQRNFSKNCFDQKQPQQNKKNK